MAGGVGSRFWPISKEGHPKQFLQFVSGKSFLRMAYERFLGLIPPENIIVVSLVKYKDLVMKDIPELSEENLLLEPYGRNTAACIAFATYTLLKRDPDAVMAVTPADHLITNEDLYRDTLRSALEYASQNRALITLGIVPDRPDTNFGYIQAAGGKDAYRQNRPVKVKTFTEKPSKELAEVFIHSGEFLWNSGLFIWRADTIRDEMEKYVPEITRQFDGWESSLGTPAELEFLTKAYAYIDRISIDYAIMEKTDIAWLYPAEFGWADIGNWESLYDYLAAKDENGNTVRSRGQILRDSRNNIIYSENKLVAVSGLENHIVVDTKNVLMIAPRDDAKIKEITSNIALSEFEEYR